MRHKKTTLITVWRQDKSGPRDDWGRYPTVRFTTYVRWERHTSLFYGSDGTEYKSDNRLGVDVDLYEGDKLVKGDDPSNQAPSDAWTVKDVRESPNWNGTKVDRWVLV